MSLFIKAEIYKYFKNRYFRLCFIVGAVVIAGALLFLPEIAVFFEESIPTRVEILKFMPFLFIGAAIVILILLPLFSDVFRYNTLKNKFYNKYSIISGKFIVSLFMALIFAVVYVAIFLVSLNFLEAGKNYSTSLIIEFIMRFVAAIPNYAALLAYLQFLTILFRNEIIVAVIYYYTISTLFTLKLIIGQMIPENLTFLHHLTPVDELYNMGNLPFDGEACFFSIVVGCIYIVIFHLLAKSVFLKGRME